MHVVVSRGAFHGVTPSFHSSEYQLAELIQPSILVLIQGLSHIRVCTTTSRTNIGAIACRGFANATTIIISQELGKNHIDTAREYGKRMLRITVIVSLIGCAVILAIRPLILDFYRDKLTETAIYYLGVFIIMTTWRLVGEGINTCLICGCFRGGGDSRFGMIVDSIFMWLVAVPLTFLAAYVFKLPPIWVYFVMSLDELEKMPVVFIHYFRRKWLTNITRDFD